MSFRTMHLDWLQGLGIAIVSAIALYANISVAQIIPDVTLPNNSNVTLENNTFKITGGSQARGNLFHSFKDFSVPTGSEAFFNNPANIQNIISRVTGNSISNIDGLIRANGTANLFLINPNGIIFGENARLNIGGSFFATSANSMKFADGFEFSAKNPQSAPLLTISVPVGLQFEANSSLIQVQGNGQGKRDVDSPIIDTQDALRVQPDKTLALVGGDISLTGATLKTAGGRIELGSVAGNGLVSLTATNKGFALGYDGVQNFGNIQLSQQATADASGEGSGDIKIETGRLSVSGDSGLYATTSGQGSAGSIKINASNAVSFVDGGGAFSWVNSNARGDGGNINIDTGILSVKNGAQLLTRTYGAGKAGSVIINATDTVFLTGFRDNTQPTIGSDVVGNSTGNGNEITIKANSIVLDNEAIVAASILNGKGKDGNPAQAGNVTLEAREQVSLKNNTRVYSEVGSNSFGNGGSINIKSPEVSLDNSVFLITQIRKNGKGKAGDINIETGRLSVSGDSGLYATTSGQGSAGSIKINASNAVSFVDGGGAFSWVNSNARGDGGNINIDTGILSVKNGAQLLTRTYGAGKAGSVIINATDTVFLTGFRDNTQPTIGSDVVGNSTGNGNEITIKANSIVLDNEAIVAASILNGKGKDGNPAQAGNVTLEAREQVSLKNNTRVYSEVGSNSFGNGGSINIKSPEVSLDNSVFLITQIRKNGKGKAGDINIETGRLSVSGDSGLYATTSGEGSAGSIKINTDSELLLKDRAQITVSSTSKSEAGNLTVNANSIRLDNSAKISADTTGGGGDIFLNSPLLLLRRGSSITTNASGNDISGGNIIIDGKNGFIVAVPNENSDIRADSANFRGGNITIKNIAGIFGIQSRNQPSLNTSDITATGATPDLSGNIEITPPDVNPSNGLVELPINLADASRQISNACTPGTRQFQNTFVATGRGGLPISPTEPLQDSSTVSAWVKLRPKSENLANTTTQPKSTAVSTTSQIASATPIVEASGWLVDSKGNLQLVAQVPQFNPHSPWKTSVSCPVSQ
ncbi:filamentous hemagglutinin N-terminal domain-containing protein [Nostoc sp. PCC 9305]|uniref:two-partner secretion domain-containing protein n=1 Tax=Nostoc sp. PCC 9305 TaxID=296636 RepID=UPI0039C5F305